MAQTTITVLTVSCLAFNIFLKQINNTAEKAIGIAPVWCSAANKRGHVGLMVNKCLQMLGQPLSSQTLLTKSSCCFSP